MSGKQVYILVVFLLVCCCVCSAQKSVKLLEGVVQSTNKDVASVHVINKTSEKATITQLRGYFTIRVELNDTLIFSAVQFKKKQLVITRSILESTSISVFLEEVVNELDEVIVRPFNLSGDLSLDMDNITIEPIVTASTLGLPNAHVKKQSYIEKKMNSVVGGGTVISLINAINGNTKRMKKFEKSYKRYELSLEVRGYYADSLFTQVLKIPKNKIEDFMSFCEMDVSFDSITKVDNKIEILDFLDRKSIAYRENNGLN